jgi:uncharacterized membrane protein YoaK (UPF0700 family)
MDGRQRRFLMWMTGFAVLCAAAQLLTGVAELALYLTPFFIIVALLACGRYIAEERIVRRWATASPPPARRARRRLRPVAVVLRASLAVGAPRSRRGPPARALLAA